jgi:PIN domain nuclease of toxin-antitoxin system
MGQSQVILLDTHVLIWLALSPSKLSANARAAIRGEREAAEGLAVSDISFLELTTLVTKGRVDLDMSLESFFQDIESRVVVLPISGRTCLRTLGLPAGYPKDLADRIIGATALVEGIPLVTADKDIRKSGACRTIW